MKKILVLLLLFLAFPSWSTTAKILKSGNSASDGFSTGAISGIGTDTQVFIFLITAAEAVPSNHTVTDAGVATWSSDAQDIYASRRLIDWWSADVTPDGTELIVTAVGETGYDSTDWVVVEIAEFDNTDWSVSAVLVYECTAVTACPTPDLGTITADQITLFVSGREDAANNFQVDTGSTQLTKLTGALDVRETIVGYSTTDNTPGTTWDTSGNGGIIGVRVSDGTDGSHAGGGSVVPIIIQQHASLGL